MSDISGAVRRRTGVVWAATGTAGVLAACSLAMGVTAPHAHAAGPALASSDLLTLKISPVGPLGYQAFQGTYGTARTYTTPGFDGGDFSDPDGVKAYAQISTEISRTSAEAAKIYAQAHAASIDVNAHGLTKGGMPLVQFLPRALPGGSSAALDTYAECVPPPYLQSALAYARFASLRIAGQEVGTGTTQLTVSGTDLGNPDLGASTLTVTVDPYQQPDSSSPVLGATSARAGIDVSVSGVLKDSSGAQVFSGPMVSAEFGHVEVFCSEAAPTNSPTPTDSASPTDTPTDSPTESPTASPTPTPSPGPTTAGPTTPAPGPTTHPASPVPGRLAASGAGNPPWLLGAGFVAFGLGFVLLVAAGVRLRNRD